MEEIEIKFLGVNVEELIGKLEKLGAVKVGDFFYKIILFDYSDMSLNQKGAYLRLRDEGNKVTLTYKAEKDFVSYEATNKDVVILEDEVVVENFEVTRKILNSIGLMEKNYQENKRIRYILNDVEIAIDFWPKIPPYVEIEGKSMELVEKAALSLGFKLEDAVRYPAGTIYKCHYGINLHEYSVFTFDEQIKR